MAKRHIRLEKQHSANITVLFRYVITKPTLIIIEWPVIEKKYMCIENYTSQNWNTRFWKMVHTCDPDRCGVNSTPLVTICAIPWLSINISRSDVGKISRLVTGSSQPGSQLTCRTLCLQTEKKDQTMPTGRVLSGELK